MLHITSAEYVDGFRVRVGFNNGYFGIADFSEALQGPIFIPLLDPVYFRTFSIEGHTVTWSNGADFAPEYILHLAQTQTHAETAGATTR
ncbi:MAG: DUF2442 domain-containing protein [Pirellulaceae bacterium]|nr:DUF2442 domain-containing protein [Pirellulaceae bacterium]